MPPIARRRPTNRREKSRPNRLKRWAGVVVIILIFLFIILNRHGLLRLYRFRAEQERLEAEIALLQERAGELRQEIASLENDLAYIERLARDKYRMVKRGEKVFRVIPSNPQTDRDGGAEAPR